MTYNIVARYIIMHNRALNQLPIADAIVDKSRGLNSVSNNSYIFQAASRGNRLIRPGTCSKKEYPPSTVSQASQARRHARTHRHARTCVGTWPVPPIPINKDSFTTEDQPCVEISRPDCVSRLCNRARANRRELPMLCMRVIDTLT